MYIPYQMLHASHSDKVHDLLQRSERRRMINLARIFPPSTTTPSRALQNIAAKLPVRAWVLSGRFPRRCVRQLVRSRHGEAHGIPAPPSESERS